MQHQFGYDMPKKMRENFGYAVKDISDHLHKELKPEEVYNIFKENYLNVRTPIDVTEAHFKQEEGGRISTEITAVIPGKGTAVYKADGNGRLDAVATALKQAIPLDFTIENYQEHAIERHSSSEAVAYVGISANGKTVWGAGRNTDIIVASINALLSAINHIVK